MHIPGMEKDDDKFTRLDALVAKLLQELATKFDHSDAEKNDEDRNHSTGAGEAERSALAVGRKNFMIA